MKLMTGNSNKPLAAAIADYIEIPLTEASVRRFADEEVFVEIHENVRGEDVFVIQSTAYPTNDNLMELLIMIDALKRASAKRITAVVPYFGYARQDRKPGPRTPISAKLVANLITTAGADRVLSVDLHAGQIQGFFDIPTDNLFGAPVMSADIQARFGDKNIMVVSPDVGGVVRARALAKRLDNAPLAIVDKRRERAGESEVMNIIGDVKGRFCILIDDIVDQDAETPLHVADDVHHFRLASALAALVDDRQRRVVEALGERTGAHHAADVGRYDHDILVAKTGLDIGRHHRRTEQIVCRDVEEALDLAGVEIDRQDAVGAGGGDQVGDQLGADRRARAGLTVLAGIAEIGNDGGDSLGRRALERIDHDQQFHQIVVGRIGRRLDHEHVFAADILMNFHENFFVGKAADAGLGQGDFDIVGDGGRERLVRIAGHEFHGENPQANWRDELMTMRETRPL